MAIDEAKKALVTDADLRQRALSKEMIMRDQISIRKQWPFRCFP